MCIRDSFYFSNVVHDVVQLAMFFFFQCITVEYVQFEDLCEHYIKIFGEDYRINIINLYKNSLVLNNKFLLTIINKKMYEYYEISTTLKELTPKLKINLKDWFFNKYMADFIKIESNESLIKFTFKGLDIYSEN